MCIYIHTYTHTHTHTIRYTPAYACTLSVTQATRTHIWTYASLCLTIRVQNIRNYYPVWCCLTCTHAHTHTQPENFISKLSHCTTCFETGNRGDTRFSKHTNMNKNYINTSYFKVTSRHHCLLHTHIRKVLSIYSVCTTLYNLIAKFFLKFKDFMVLSL